MTSPQAILSKVHRLFNFVCGGCGVVVSLGGWGGVPGLRGVYVSSLARRIVRMVF